MSPTINDLLTYVQKEVDFILENYALISFQELNQSKKHKRAAEWSLGVIGEACKRLPQNFQTTYSHINWNRLSDLSNEMHPKYISADNELIWNLLKSDIPKLKDKIDPLVEKHS